MSPDLFPKYLKDPALLYRISYEELKTLVVEYPYCQNLRYLLLMKSQLANHPERERNLQMAAAYTLDRQRLFLAIQEQSQQEDKDLEFLDLHHQGDAADEGLDLPILDFSQQDLSGSQPPSTEEEPESSILNLTEEFDLSLFFPNPKEDTPSEQAGEGETGPAPAPSLGQNISWAMPLVPPLFPAGFSPQGNDAPAPPDTGTPPAHFAPALVPPPFPVFLALPNDTSGEALPPGHDMVENHPIHVLVPPLFPAFLPAPADAPPARTSPPSLAMPLVPPLVEEVWENGVSDIDLHIQQAIARLAELQQKELEEEEREEEKRLTELIKQEILGQHPDLDKGELLAGGEQSPPPLPPEPQTIPKTGPMPKTSFSSWLKQMKSPQPGKGPEPKPQEKKDTGHQQVAQEGKLLLKAIKAKKKERKREETEMQLLRKRKVMELAEESLSENAGIISETLAQILVAQGKMDKAAAMYRQLMLKFPKKSSYFAAELDKITK